MGRESELLMLNNNIGLRIKEIRKLHNLNQDDFAKSLGLSRVYIGQVETGTRSFSDRTINDICRKYLVSKEWLVNGTGEMKDSLPDVDLLMDFVTSVLTEDENSFKRKLLLYLAELHPEEWLFLENLIKVFQKS